MDLFEIEGATYIEGGEQALKDYEAAKQVANQAAIDNIPEFICWSPDWRDELKVSRPKFDRSEVSDLWDFIRQDVEKDRLKAIEHERLVRDYKLTLLAKKLEWLQHTVIINLTKAFNQSLSWHSQYIYTYNCMLYHLMTGDAI